MIFIRKAIDSWKQPTKKQAIAGNYKKPRVSWNGLEIAIENPVGSVREGKGWQTVMKNAYGYVCRSEGVDGDEVDVYIGPNMDGAKDVYVVHQRKYGDWSKYDEDKVMLGFNNKEDAKIAYLKHYDDARFFGSVTVMPVNEFVKKVKKTNEKPTMIKCILFLKSRIQGYTRKDGTYVRPYFTKVNKHEDKNQLSLFSSADKDHGKANDTKTPMILLPKKVVNSPELVNTRPVDAKQEGKVEFNGLDLKNPKTYEENPEIKKVARDLAMSTWDHNSPMGEYKREFMNGMHADIVLSKLLEIKKKEDYSNKKAATALKNNKENAPAFVEIPKEAKKSRQTFVVSKIGRKWIDVKVGGGSYTNKLALTSDTIGLEVGREYTMDVMKHSEFSKHGTKTTLYPISESQLLAGREAAKEKERIASDELKRQEDALKEKRSGIEKIPAGSFGPFIVRGVSNGYRVSFKYSPENVANIKDIGGSKYDPAMKEWFVDTLHTDKLKKLLDEAKEISAKEEVTAKEETNQRRVLVAAGQDPYDYIKNGKITGYGKPFRINEDHPSIEGSHLLGYEGDLGHYVYYTAS